MPTELLDPLNLERVLHAEKNLSSKLSNTRLLKSEPLSRRYGTNIYLKLELEQPTKSFKVRGAYNKMLRLSPEERNRGVVAVSGGNHAQGVAFAARELGIESPVILMSRFTPPNYLDATRRLGAKVVLTESLEDGFHKVNAYVSEGFTYIHPFDDPDICAGQGTIGLELLNELPQLTDVVVSIGGGGLMAGIATAVKARKPFVRVWGVETRGMDSMAEALKAGKVVRLEKLTSKAKTLGVQAIPENNLRYAQQYLEGQRVTVVEDWEAEETQKLLYQHHRLLAELAASCTLSAVSHLPVGKDNHVALILCGGNVPEDEVAALVNSADFSQRVR